MRFYAGTYTSLGGPGIVICHFTGNSISCVEAVHDFEDPEHYLQ